MLVLADDAEEIVKAIKKETAKRCPSFSGARIEVELKGIDEPMEMLAGIKGKKTFTIELPENKRLAGKMIVPVRVYENGRSAGSIDIRSSIVIFREVLVSSGRIQKGMQLTSKDVYFSERNIGVLPSSVIFRKEDVIGKEAMTFIPEGTVLLDWMFRQVPSVRKGDEVEIFKVVSGMSVKTKAVALEDGYLGKGLKVKNLSSGRTVSGIVRSTDEVEAQ